MGVSICRGGWGGGGYVGVCVCVCRGVWGRVGGVWVCVGVW